MVLLEPSLKPRLELEFGLDLELADHSGREMAAWS